MLLYVLDIRTLNISKVSLGDDVKSSEVRHALSYFTKRGSHPSLVRTLHYIVSSDRNELLRPVRSLFSNIRDENSTRRLRA